MEVNAVPATPGPLARRRQLGTALRRYRVDAGLSINDVARELLCSAAKISRLETAQRPASLRDVRDLCNLYRVSPSTRAKLMKLAEESREAAWWQQRRLEPNLEKYVGLEGAAREIIDYQNSVVPGLLQTAEYAEAILRLWIPDDPAALADTVEIRMKRQDLLESDTSVRIVIDESALRRPIGGPEIMRRQFDRLIELSNVPLIDMRVIPYAAGEHKGTTGGFTVLRFSTDPSSHPELELPDVVYVEGVAAGQYFDQPGEVRAYIDLFATLQEAALPKADTTSFLESVRRTAGSRIER
ncbi:helix-turn-helix transcriptional regulator [Actinoplanes sp. NPDC026670]|uniref:helix-turn-helix domain-containing protein n=1 Tax=Actinoplanes sp. NPDC026670 TaxID=3154700 RepID=UPI0033D110E5